MIGVFSVHCESGGENLQRVWHLDWARGEEGLVFLRGAEKGSPGTKLGVTVRT
jgi:hypothetical protein